MLSFIESFKAARRSSVPLIAIHTADPGATIEQIDSKTKNDVNRRGPIFKWDCVNGILAVNDMARPVLQAVHASTPPAKLVNPIEALMALDKLLPEKSILFFMNVQRFFQAANVVQAIWNLRDAIKGDKKTLAMLGPSFTLPAELVNDVLLLDEPRPTAEELEAIIKDSYEGASIPLPNKETIAKAVDATLGLPAFPAEQQCAMSMTSEGMDVPELWERKRKQVEQTKGTSVYRGGDTFKDVRGNASVIKYLKMICNSKTKYRGIVFFDEIEKMFAGSGGDSSGTTQEMLGTLLRWMEDNGVKGLLFIGQPGVCKSGIAKACGNELEVPFINFDVTAMKDKHVGESTNSLREGLKMVDGITQGKAFCIATCNAIDNLPTALRRRFKRGTFFFDIPNEEEGKSILDLYMKKYSIKKQPLPDISNWTGAEIQQLCEMADEYNVPLAEAAKYVVPIAISASEKVEALRRESHGKYLSSSYEGFYQMPQTDTPKEKQSRKIALAN